MKTLAYLIWMSHRKNKNKNRRTNCVYLVLAISHKTLQWNRLCALYFTKYLQWMKSSTLHTAKHVQISTGKQRRLSGSWMMTLMCFEFWKKCLSRKRWRLDRRNAAVNFQGGLMHCSCRLERRTRWCQRNQD